MTATTPTPQPVRGTAKALRTAGLDLSQPVTLLGYGIDGPDAKGNRYESVRVDRQGVHGVKTDGTTHWFGGVATRFWLVQIVEASAPAAALPLVDGRSLELINDGMGFRISQQAMGNDKASHALRAAAAGRAAAVEDAELDRMGFAELMVIAKALKVPGRGTARIDALRAGIRTAREVAARAVARSERAAAATPGTGQLSGWGELAAAHRAGMAA